MKILHFFRDIGCVKEGNITIFKRLNAVVIARDMDDAFYQLRLRSPDWAEAEHFEICRCRDTLTPRVLSMEFE